MQLSWSQQSATLDCSICHHPFSEARTSQPQPGRSALLPASQGRSCRANKQQGPRQGCHPQQGLAEPPQTPAEAVPPQAGLCHQPQAGLTQGWDGGETGHGVGRKQVLSLLGASQGHNSRHPASAMGKLPHKARCCHHHQNSLAGTLPPPAPGERHQHGGTACLGWTPHLKATGSDSQTPRASPSLDLVRCQGDPHSDGEAGAEARLVSGNDFQGHQAGTVAPTQLPQLPEGEGQREWLSITGL